MSEHVLDDDGRRFMEINSVVVYSVANIITVKVPIDNEFLATLLWSTGNPSFFESVLGSRLLINLKEVGEMGICGDTRCKPSSQFIGDIEFDKGHDKGQHLHLIYM